MKINYLTTLGKTLGLPIDRESEIVNLLKSSRGIHYIKRVASVRSKSNPEATWRCGTGRPRNQQPIWDYYIDKNSDKVYQARKGEYKFVGTIGKNGVPKPQKLYAIRVTDARGYVVTTTFPTFNEQENLESYKKILRLMGHLKEEPITSFFDDLSDEEGDFFDGLESEDSFEFGDDLEDDDENTPKSLSEFNEGQLVYNTITEIFYTLVKFKGQMAIVQEWNTGKKSMFKSDVPIYLPAEFE